LGDKVGAARALTYISITTYWQGEYAEAAAVAAQAVALQNEWGDASSTAYAREIQAMAVAKSGDLAQGMQLLQQCLAAFRTISDQSGQALIWNDMGLVAYLQGDAAQAITLHQAALQAAWAIGDKRRMAFCLEGIAMSWALGAEGADDAAAAQTHQLRTVQLFGAVAALRTAIGAPLPPTERADYEQSLVAVRTRVEPLRFEAAWREGEEMPLEAILNWLSTNQ
ncbi:MAG: hypothetical protein M3Q45_07535, partial [Chloroflexota bacterium]|nr:hypothetical protein [Chloroflexota bacterium]